MFGDKLYTLFLEGQPRLTRCKTCPTPCTSIFRLLQSLLSARLGQYLVRRSEVGLTTPAKVIVSCQALIAVSRVSGGINRLQGVSVVLAV